MFSAVSFLTKQSIVEGGLMSSCFIGFIPELFRLAVAVLERGLPGQTSGLISIRSFYFAIALC